MDQTTIAFALLEITNGWYPHSLMVKVIDCGMLVSEFELQLRYYLHFQTNTLEKGMNRLTLLAMGYIVPLLFF